MDDVWSDVVASVCLNTPGAGSYQLGMAELFRGLPAAFYKAPASTSGLYHPEDERAPGGLALHSWRMAKIMPDMVRMVDERPTPAMMAGMVVAAVCHDSLKPTLPKWDYPLHPLAAATWVRDNWTADATAKGIASVACALHEGRWTDDRCLAGWSEEWQEVRQLYPWIERVMHAADYMLSRSILQIIIGKPAGEVFRQRLVR